MDIQKAMQAVNAAQNAADKVRPFFNMVQTLNDLWEVLKDVNPDELKKIVAQRDELLKTVGDLMDQKQQLITDTGKINADYQAKTAALTSEYDAKKKALQSDQDKLYNDLIQAFKVKEQEARTAIDQQDSQMRNLASKKEGLEQQIAQLKNIANSVAHA
jgi:chromosome segregation ATPase